MNKFKIRVLGQDDWRIYKGIRLDSLKESPDSFGSTVEKEATFPDEEWQSRLDSSDRAKHGLCLIAEIDGQAVGIAWGLMHAPNLKVAHIYQMWVLPAHRGKGIARSLMGRLKEWAKEQGCVQIELAVTSNNEAAVALYSAAGFVATGPLEELREGSALTVQSMTLSIPAGQK